MVAANSTKNLLNKAARAISVTKFLSYQDYLAEIYSQIKTSAHSYSYLQFAEDLGFSKTNVIRLVIAGERPLTEKAAEKVGTALNLRGVERRYWLAMVSYNNERLPAERERHFKNLLAQKQRELPKQIDQRQLEYFNEWFYPVVREITALPGFNGDPEWVRERLCFPLRLEEIKRALDLLEKLEYLQRNEETGQLQPTTSLVMTEREIDSLSIVRYHQKMIEIGRESITRIDGEKRDIRAMTFRIPESSISEAKAKIDQLLSELIKIEVSGGEQGEVYQLNLQLFPFTKS